MDWLKLFSGTFILIFLAELGDKTQLAAMAKTADSPDTSWTKWVVFLAASLALATSTFIAVFLGHLLKRVVPDERYIRLASAVLFLIFGFMILYEVVSSFRAEAGTVSLSPIPAAAAADRPTGLVGGLALRAAIDFESLSMERYRKLAARSGPELAAMLLKIAAEEESHLDHLRGMPKDMREDDIWNREIPTRTGVSGRNLPADDLRALERLIDLEDSSAAFYADLAGRARIPSVRAVLTHLADEERSHADQLRRQLI
jgi:rubrerythrin